MTIDFLRPLFLLLLVAIPLIWFFPRRIDRIGRGVLRSLLFALVIVALAGPVLLSPEGSVFQVFVLDQSASVSGVRQTRARQLLDQWQKQVENPDHSAVIVVGNSAPVGPDLGLPSVASGEGRASAPGVNRGPGKAQTQGPALPPNTSNLIQVTDAISQSSLSAALAAAERQIPAGSAGVVTLVSDGLATDRRWGPAVQQLIDRGIPVAAYDLGRDENDVYPVRLSADPLMRVGQTARLGVEVVGRAETIRVRLSDSAGRELALSAPVSSNGRVTIPLEFEPSDVGFLSVKAEVVAASGADANAANNSLRQTFAVQGPLRLFYLGDRIRQGAARLGELLGRGFVVQDAGDLPLDATTDLSNSDLVLIDDRPASKVPEEFQARLSTAIREGGLGLLFSGGKASFGTGGYDRAMISKMLPVDFVQRTEKQDPSTALAVIVDTSGSMTGSRIELAKQVVRLAIRRLKAHDRVGIVEFYGNKHWALPMQSAANKITIDRAIGRMQATGGTVMYPAIEEAYYGLKNVNTRYKHILIITDAGVEDADYEGLARLIVKDNVNVSTVLVGAGAHSQSLIDIASWGHGRFYSASDRYALPEVILKQATTMNLPAYKTGGFPVVGRGGAGWWGEIDRQAMPELEGYVETQGRPGAEILVEVAGSTHPVLASWQYGLGRVTTLTTEPLGDGTGDWKTWKDYGRWLARIASRTAGDTRPFHFDVERNDHQLTVRARRYGDASALFPQASVLDASGKAGPSLEFRQLTPGHFSAETVMDPIKEVRLTAGAADANGVIRPMSTALLVSTAAADVSFETQVDPESALNLSNLANATGGDFVEMTATTALTASPVPPGNAASLSLIELWPYVALLALLLYLLELAYRRWPRNAPRLARS